MIITRTPFRISFFGGGTDYPEWYLRNGGSTLSTTIDKYCYLTVRYLPPFHEYRFCIVYRQIELCSGVSQIEHPAVRAVIQHLGAERGLEMHYFGDLPARSGMGTSSAFTVGLLHAISALYGQMKSKEQLAREAIYLEQDVLQEVVGSQDQVSAAFGGLNHISFRRDGTFDVQPLPLSRDRLEELNSHLMLFYTGIKRTAAKVAQTYVTGIEQKRPHLERMQEFVQEAISILTSGGDLSRFGQLLHDAWQVKRGLSSSISNSQVDDMYNAARRHGAMGGKLLGAGGGGFMLVFAPPERHAELREAFSDLIYVPVRMDFEGSRVVYFQPEQDYAELDLTRCHQQLRPMLDSDPIGFPDPNDDGSHISPAAKKPR